MSQTEREIIEKKIVVFTERECLDKLIEELEEALIAAKQVASTLTNPMYKVALMEELADVEVAGRRTLTKLWPSVEREFTKKVGKAIFTQIPAAIEAKRKQSEKEIPLALEEATLLKEQLAKKTMLMLIEQLETRLIEAKA